MKLKAVYSSLDEIPENYRDLFEERDHVFYLTKIEGMKTDADVNRVNTALANEKSAHATTKRQYEEFLNGRSFEDIQKDLDRLPELEAAAAGKMDEEKINQLVEARIKTKLAPVERDRDLLKNKLSESEKTIEGFQTKERQRTIHDKVREAAMKMKVLDTAQEDVLMLAERMFEIGEDGSVTAKDGVGVTPGVTPDIWLTEMQQKRPHWWPASSGGGSKGSGGGNGMANNPWSAEHWNMTEQGKIVQAQGLEKAAALAKSVGVDINRPVRPVVKK